MRDNIPLLSPSAELAELATTLTNKSGAASAADKLASTMEAMEVDDTDATSVLSVTAAPSVSVKLHPLVMSQCVRERECVRVYTCVRVFLSEREGACEREIKCVYDGAEGDMKTKQTEATLSEEDGPINVSANMLQEEAKVCTKKALANCHTRSSSTYLNILPASGLRVVILEPLVGAKKCMPFQLFFYFSKSLFFGFLFASLFLSLALPSFFSVTVFY